MRVLNDNLLMPIFDSKIKFYFSLLFITVHDFKLLTDNFGDDIDIFNKQTIFDLKCIFKLNKLFEEINDTYNMINLSDKTLLKLFDKHEVENYYNSYSTKNVNFDTYDANDLNDFYIYMFLEKVKEKKEIEFGTIYDLFDSFSDEEIINAVANLDYEDKKKFIYLFGIKGDITFELNTSDSLKKDILIKLYSYMLEKRDDCNIPKIISNIIEKEAYQHNFFDYIRGLCKDNSLSNEFIVKMLSKMDHNSIRVIKEVFGDDLKKKARPLKDKTFKTAINNLTIIIKVNKTYEKEKNKRDSFKEKKKAGFEEKKNVEKKETDKKIKEEFVKENKTKEDIKQEEINEQNKVNDIEKQKDKKTKEENKSLKEEDKNLRLKLFLEKNSLNKNDFYKAFKLLEPLSKSVIALYYGIDKKPLELEKIKEELEKDLDDVLFILEDAEDKIIDLIKSGKINLKENNKKEILNDKTKENKKEEHRQRDNRLLYFINENEISSDVLIKVVPLLAPIEMVVVDSLLNEHDKKDIATTLGIEEQRADELINECTDKMIDIISPLKKSVEPKETSNEKETKKTEKENESILNDFLFKNKLSKKEFYERFKTLDSFSKIVLASYLGFQTTALLVSDIAIKYGKSITQIEKIIEEAKDKIVKKPVKIDKLNLNMLLSKYKITKDDFNKAVDNLDFYTKSLVKSYFGIGMFSKSLEELSSKYGKTPNEINQMITGIVSKIRPTTKAKENKQKEKLSALDKFLTLNNLTNLELLTILNLLSPDERSLVAMHLGLNGKELDIDQMALLTQMPPLLVKYNLENALSKVMYLSRINKTLNKNNQENMNFYTYYKNLLNDVNFITLAGKTNPLMTNILLKMRENGFNVNKTSKSMNLSSDEIMRSLMDASILGNSYLEDTKNPVNSVFNDREKSKKTGRRY